MFQQLVKKFISWLYRLLEDERVRLEAIRIDKVRADIDQQARALDADRLRDKTHRQTVCSHTKGGRLRTHNDYAISDHTFIDGSRVVRCLICGKPWSKALGNWDEAESMLTQTTNTRTSSEGIFTVKDQIFPASTRPAKPELEPLAPYISFSLYQKLLAKFVELRKPIKAKRVKK